MGAIQKTEIELIRYEKLRHVHIFLINVLYRNMHEHSDFELNLILEGRVVVRSRGGEIRAGAGELLLFNSYEPHEIAVDGGGPARLLSMQLSNHFCREYFSRLHNAEFLTADLKTVLSPEETALLRRQMLEASLTFFREEPEFQLDCVGQVCGILARLLRCVPHVFIDDQEYAARKRKTARIRRITDYIDQHYKEKIMLPDLARQEGITTTYLSHFFHDTFHMTFQDYLNRLRLEKALILMKDPSLHLVDICLECGFSDNKYLNQIFLKKFGCRAAEYRRRLSETDGLRQEVPASYSQFPHTREDSLELLEAYLKRSAEAPD